MNPQKKHGLSPTVIRMFLRRTGVNSIERGYTVLLSALMALFQRLRVILHFLHHCLNLFLVGLAYAM